MFAWEDWSGLSLANAGADKTKKTQKRIRVIVVIESALTCKLTTRCTPREAIVDPTDTNS